MIRPSPNGQNQDQSSTPVANTGSHCNTPTITTAMTNSTATPRYVYPMSTLPTVGPASTPPNMSHNTLATNPLSVGPSTPTVSQPNSSRITTVPWPTTSSSEPPRIINAQQPIPTPPISAASNISTANSSFLGHAVGPFRNGSFSMTQALPFTINHTAYAFAAIPGSATIGSKPALMLLPLDQLPSPGDSPEPKPQRNDSNPHSSDPLASNNWTGVDTKLMQQGLLNQYLQDHQQSDQQQTNDTNSTPEQHGGGSQPPETTTQTAQQTVPIASATPHPSRRPTKPPIPLFRALLSETDEQPQHVQTHYRPPRIIATRPNRLQSNPSSDTANKHDEPRSSQSSTVRLSPTRKRKRQHRGNRRKKNRNTNASGSMSETDGSTQSDDVRSPPPKRHKPDNNNNSKSNAQPQKKQHKHRQRARKWPGDTLSTILAGPPPPMPSGSSCGSLSTGWSDHPSAEETGRLLTGLCEVDDIYSSDEQQAVLLRDDSNTDEHEDDDDEENQEPNIASLDRFRFTNNNTNSRKASQSDASHPVDPIHTTDIDMNTVHEALTAPQRATTTINRPPKPAKSCGAIIDPREKVAPPQSRTFDRKHNRRNMVQPIPSLPSLSQTAVSRSTADSLTQQTQSEQEQPVAATPSVSPQSVAEPYLYQPPQIKTHHPFAAGLPAQIATEPVQYATFEEALLRSGKFGRHSGALNWRQIYYVMGHLAEVLSDGKIKVMAFDYSGAPTQRTKSKICPYWPDCRSCTLKQTHIACVIGTCGIFHSRYSLEPDDKTWAAVQHRNGSNKVMLDLIKNNHEWLYKDIKRHLVWLLDNNMKYIDNVLVPICKNINGRRKICIRGTNTKNYKHIRGHFGVDIAAINAKKREKDLIAECERWIQTIWSGQPVGLAKKIACGHKSGFFRSRCPKHTKNPDRCCRMKNDGRITNPQWMLFWDSAEYCAWCRYYCETHDAVKVSATHPELLYHYTESVTRPCFRHGNTHVSTTCAAAMRRTYRTNKLTYKALRETMLTNYEQKLDRDIIANIVNCPDQFVATIRRKALDRIVPNTQTLTQILQSVQLEVYPESNNKLDRLWFSTTPRHFGVDQTFDELSKVTLEDGTKLNIGCGSVATDLGYWCKWYIVNDLAENFDQTSKYCAEIKGQVMYYGDLQVLVEHGITFSIDHLEKFQNLDVYIDHELEHNLKENELYAPIAAKLDDHNITVRDVETRKGECSMHLNRRKYKYAKKDGVNTANHRDFILVTESETIWANSLQHADENMPLYPRNDPLNVCGTRSDEYVQKHWGFLSATDVYWRYVNEFQNEVTAAKYKDAIVQILQLESYTDLVSRYEGQQKLKENANYQYALPLLREIALGVHLDHVRQILGIFITAEEGVDTEWIQKYREFTDQRGRSFAFMTRSTLHHIGITLCKYFGRDTADGEYIMILQPRKDFMAMLYDIMKRTLRTKIYESLARKTKPIMKYPHINKAIHLAATPLSITGFVNNYNTDVSGVWINVNNERIHCTAKFMEAAACRGQKKAARAVLDVEIKRFHANETIIDHLLRDIPELFDDHFKEQYDNIKEWICSRYFNNIEVRGICVNLTNKWTDHVTATRDLLNRRDIQRQHKKITRKLDRKLFHQDILLLRASTNTVTVDILAYLYGRHGHSIQTLSKSLLRHGFDSDKFDDGSLVIDPQNAGKIYNMIEDKQFKEVIIAPQTNSNHNEPSQDIIQLNLPEIPPAFQTQQHCDTDSSPPSSVQTATNNRRTKQSDKAEMDDTPEPNGSPSPEHASSPRLIQYENVGEPTDVDGVYKYRCDIVLHGAYQVDNFNAATKAIEFINQQIPHVALNKFIIDDLDWRYRSKKELIEDFKDSSALARLFGPYIAASDAKKIAKYMGNEANYDRFKRFTGLSALDADPIEQYRERHKTQLGVRPLGGNLLGNESLINPARRRRKEASQKQDAIYLDSSKRPKTKAKWKQQTVFYDDYENYALPMVQWAEGCKCKRDEIHEAIKNGNHSFLSWPSASLFEHQALDELSLFTLDAMGTKQRKQLAEWHGWDKSKHGNNVASAVDFLVVHHIMGEDMNDMTEEQVSKKLKAFFDWNKAIWMKQGRRFKKKAITSKSYRKKK